MIGLASAASAASLNEARVTRATNDVQLLDPIAASRRASLNVGVREGTVLRTGKDSHAELTFSDETVVRLAANTAFHFKNGTRDLNLAEGAVLVQAPKSANGATIHAASVAAASGISRSSDERVAVARVGMAGFTAPLRNTAKRGDDSSD